MSVTSDLPAADAVDERYWLAIDRIAADLERHGDLDQLCELSATHAEWPVRAACVRILGARFADREPARAAIAAATHDQVDTVAFTAITVAGEQRVSLAAKDLIGI